MKTNRKWGVVWVASAIAVALARPAASPAQGLPRPTLRIEGGSPAAAPFSSDAPGGLASRDAEVRTWTASAAATIPVVLDDGRTLLFGGLSYRRWAFPVRRWPAGLARGPEDLHEVALTLTCRRQLNATWALTGHVSPQVASDLTGRGLGSGDWKLQAAVVAERPYGERWQVGFGAAYASTLGKPLPLPVLTFRYESGGRFHAEGNLPESAGGWWRLGARTEAGLAVRAEGNLFHVPSLGARQPALDDPQLQYLAVLVGPSLIVRTGERSQVRLDAGVIHQGLRLCDGTDEVANGNYDLDRAAFVRLGIETCF